MSAPARNTAGAAVDITTDMGCKPFNEMGLLGSSSRVAMASWKDCIEMLHSFRALEDDWDGGGALAPEASLLDGAINLAHSLRQNQIIPVDRVHVSADGTVIFEWFGNGRAYLEIEVIGRHQAEKREILQDSSVTEELIRIA